MTDWDPEAFENAMLADMRANGGAVTSGPFAGMPILVMNSKGVKSGQPRRAFLAYTRDGADYVIAGSKGGGPTDPLWLKNIQVDPIVDVEAEGRTFKATATVTEPDDRRQLWDKHVEAMPQFAEYLKTTDREIQMVRLTPTV